MAKLAFVFAGQGAQFPGMGKSLYEGSAAARAVFDMAERVRPHTLQQCFEGPHDLLNLTVNTQPCMFLVDLAAGLAAREAGIEPDLLAGFSLGEMAALTFAEAFADPETAFRLVCARAKAMQQAAEQHPGAMAAVLRLPSETVEAACREFKAMYPVNYNAPGQLVVSGSRDEMDSFSARITELGGRVKRLSVSGSFHSPFMATAAQTVKDLLTEIDMKQPRIPVYANVTAKPYAGDLRALLYEQTQSPVRWQETILHMAEDGAYTFIEMGPGKTLSGLIKKTLKDVRVLNVQEIADIAQIKKDLNC